MKKYLLISFLSIQSTFEYRVNLIWRLAGTALSTLLIYYFWTAVIGTGFGENQYSKASLATYYILITLMSLVVEFNFKNVSNDIRDGYLSVHLLKPYNYFAAIFADSIGEKIFNYTFFAIALGILLLFNLLPGTTTLSIGLGVISTILATFMFFFLGIFMGSLAFWFQRVHGIEALFFNIGGLFSGRLIPINLLPQLFLKIAEVLPFAYMAYVPTQFFLIPTTKFEEVVKTFSLQSIWILIFFVLTIVVWKLGINKYESSGN